MEDKNNIEILRKRLHVHILQYGKESQEVLKTSQELDKLIVNEMRRRVDRNRENWVQLNMKRDN